MARNTRAIGSNNFEWTIGDITAAAYVDSPILKEFYSTGRTQNGNNITFAELINIGSFNNFGYLGGEDSNFSIQDNKNIIDFIRAVDHHLKDLNSLVTALENNNPNFIKVTHLLVNKSTLSLKPGLAAQLIVTVKPDNATNKNVSWSSTNSAVATVNQNGMVTGVAMGTTTVIATSVDGGKTAIVNVEVTEASLSYYWYIGIENPLLISDIKTDNTVPGWHEIGSSLSGFVIDTNTNKIKLSTTRVIYYIIIPNELHIYNGLNINVESIDFETVTCNISGYKAFRFVPEEGVTGVKTVQGPIIR